MSKPVVTLNIELYRDGDGWIAEVADLRNTVAYGTDVQMAVYRAAELAVNVLQRRLNEASK